MTGSSQDGPSDRLQVTFASQEVHNIRCAQCLVSGDLFPNGQEAVDRRNRTACFLSASLANDLVVRTPRTFRGARRCFKVQGTQSRLGTGATSSRLPPMVWPIGLPSGQPEGSRTRTRRPLSPPWSQWGVGPACRRTCFSAASRLSAYCYRRCHLALGREDSRG